MTGASLRRGACGATRVSPARAAVALAAACAAWGACAAGAAAAAAPQGVAPQDVAQVSGASSPTAPGPPAVPGALPAAPGAARPGARPDPPSPDVLADCPPSGPISVLDGELQRWPRSVRRGAVTIVALGSSSTAGAGASSSANEYPSRLQAELRDLLPGVSVRVVNAGRNGEEIADMYGRFDAAVLAHDPDLVVWQFGSNALLRGGNVEDIERIARGGIAGLRERGIDVMLMDLQHAPRIERMPERDRMLGLIVRISDATRTPLFRRHRLMGAWRDALGDGYGRMLSQDGLHMNDLSYACMARVLALALRQAALRDGRLSTLPDGVR